MEEEVRKGSRSFAIPANTDGTGRELTDDERMQLASFTRDIVQVIRQTLINHDNFWLFAGDRASKYNLSATAGVPAVATTSSISTGAPCSYPRQLSIT